MAKLTFVLKDAGSKAPTAIKFFYSCTDGRLPYDTGERVNPKQWPDNIDKGTTAVLNRIRAAIDELTVDCKIKDQPLTKRLLKARLDALLKKQKKEVSLSQQMEEVIDKMEAGALLTPTEKKYSKGSIKSFRFTASLLERFKPGLQAPAVNMETYKQFISWCQGAGREYSTNYIGSQIKNWKRLGSLVGGNDVYENKKFKKIQEDAQDIYLDESELQAMYDLDIEDKNQGIARDWFLIGAFTGLRVSDLLALTEENIYKNTIQVMNVKTSEVVIIPVHPKVQAIRKRNRGFPPKMYSHDLNRLIKKVAKQAGINDKVLVTITKGGKKQSTFYKKWELVSVHTGRRSIITNMRTQKDGSDVVVMKVTGIKSAATLAKYTKLTPEEAAKIAAGMEFFK